ncbi:MAG TPA: prepilin-type N-terminal cleavage/methylation domain-containing protein [Candidatus Nanoarchaeia archaeon]
MIEKLRSHLRKEKGFTLIELLVVIAIIAILVLIVIVVIDPAARIRAANDSTAESDVRSVASGLGACITSVLAGDIAGATDPYDAATCGDTSEPGFLTTNDFLENIPDNVTIAAGTAGTQVCAYNDNTGGNGNARWQSSTGELEGADVNPALACP